ncbi:MAG: ribose-phosphate diphosphokinase, partial [Actinobacteria bacterium]|nr:ribose-phosphate diphosphokinase [Actinomycetota bacterium]
GDANIVEFANGELRPRFGESIRGGDVFIMQTHCSHDGRSINDSIMEQLIMIDTAYRASAKRVTAVCPFYGYARQDRKAEGREPITARLIADMFKAAGSKRMVSIDLHSGQIQGFFEGPVDHLTAIPVLEQYVRDNAREGLVIVSPDAGRVKVAERFAQHLTDMSADVAFINKRRPKNTTNIAEAKEVIGDVEGRLCITSHKRRKSAQNSAISPLFLWQLSALTLRIKSRRLNDDFNYFRSNHANNTQNKNWSHNRQCRIASSRFGRPNSWRCLRSRHGTSESHG